MINKLALELYWQTWASLLNNLNRPRSATKCGQIYNHHCFEFGHTLLCCYHIMILVYFTVGSTSSGSAFVIAPNLGAKILSEYFTGSAPPILCSWSYSQIGCSIPLYSRSVSLIGSAYLFLYISFCFWFNKLLTNLTLLRQHLQYTA